MQSPDLIFPELFVAVQSARLFDDSKTFVDLEPLVEPQVINRAFLEQREMVGFKLTNFIDQYFTREEIPSVVAQTQPQPGEHIRALWPALTRQPKALSPYSSRLELKHPYVVPGGRFNEIFYWDSYFTQLGLVVDGEQARVDSMVANFAALIEQLGFIPNGNRSYFLSRSQPPFFALMLDLLSETAAQAYLPQLRAEYAFWMDGGERLEVGVSHRRVAKTSAGLLNRYWDDAATPRPESYIEDVELAEQSGREGAELFRDLRAAAESGWDFSSRWFAALDEGLGSIRTTEILPVDLNCLLYITESTLASLESDSLLQKRFESAASQRAEAIRSAFYDESLGYFTDLNRRDLSHRSALTLATLFPLYVGIATPEQAQSVAKIVEQRLLRAGGWVTTEVHSGEQWDAPNGWAPLQWIAFIGLSNYGFSELAERAARAWIEVNDLIFAQHGKMIEKYDVESLGRLSGGGEYAVQDGFGWSNGVYQALQAKLAAAAKP